MDSINCRVPGSTALPLSLGEMYLTRRFRPNFSRVFRSSGWKMIRTAIAKMEIVLLKRKLMVLRPRKLVTMAKAMISRMPRRSCQALESRNNLRMK
jgi:hypothetical protein